MTRDQVNGLIERLADKTLGFGCNVIVQDNEYDLVHAVFLSKDSSGRHTYFLDGEFYSDEPHTILGHPIMLTDVLEKIKNFHTEPEKAPEHIGCLMDTDNACCDLMRLWWNLGFTRSLQDILNEAEWDQTPAKDPCSTGETNYYIESMKGPAAELFAYLETLFPSNP